MIDVEKFMMNIRINLLRTMGFYGHVLMQLPVIYVTDGSVPTMGVGKSHKEEIMVKLFVNPEYVQEIVDFCHQDEDKVVNHFTEVLRHEVHHLIFGHLTLELPDKQRQTVACELADNSYVDRSKLVSTTDDKPGVFPEAFDLPSKLSVHEYYDKLNDNKKFNEMRQNMSSSIEIELSGKNSKNGNSNNGNDAECNNEENENGSGKTQATIDSHIKWSVIEGDEMTNEMVKDIIRQANETCKQMNNWGNIPSDIKEAINDSYAVDVQIIPWEVILKDFLASSSENVLDYTMKRRSKRYGTRPGTKKEDTLHVAIGIDTSGSIDMDMFKMFFNELHGIDKTGTKMTVFEWDTEVHREYDFKEFDGNVQGRGGTDPTEFLELVSERKFDCVIIFTDLYFAPIKENYNIPMLWVCDRGSYSWYNDESDDYPVNDGIIMKVNKNRDGFDVVRK
jgi:predicted metal-dependent peptidase